MLPVDSVEPLVETAGDVREQAAALGYLFFLSALEAERVLRVRRAVLRACASRGWLDPAAPEQDALARHGLRVASGEEGWVTLQAEVLVLPELDALRRHPFVLGVLERLFGRPAGAGRGDVCRVAPPAVPELMTPAHQDAFYVRDTAQWTAWIPLGDCPLRLGGLAILPGSHRQGLLEHGPATEGAAVPAGARWASADYRSGDVLLFSSLTVHGALPNQSGDRLRLSVDFRYGAG